MNQSFTFIDVGGNQAQYSVSDRDDRADFRWSTDHGDHGFAASFGEAQSLARAVLKASMAVNRRSDESARMRSYSSRWQSR